MRRDRSLRAARGVSMAAVATFAALMSHVAAGGAMPGWLGIVVAFSFGAVISSVVVGAGPSLVRTVIAVASSQILFHVLFVLGSPTIDLASLSHGHHHLAGPAVAAVMDPATHAIEVMWGAHAVAAAFTVAAIHLGDRLVSGAARVVDDARAWLGRVVRRARFTPRSSDASGGCIVVGPRAVLARMVSNHIRRRGPPLPLEI